jgi:DNA primase
VDFAKYGLMISTTTKPRDIWHGRVIIPIYNRSNQVIFYQGRSFTGAERRWESPSAPKTNVLFGYHNIDDHSKDYVIVCEGTFDAMCIDGVAILGSEFTSFHVRALNGTHKQKIVVPQRDKRGYAMAMQALEHGYSLSFPDIGGAQDINDAVIQYGRLYTERQIVSKATTSKYEAQLKLGLWCSN